MEENKKNKQETKEVTKVEDYKAALTTKFMPTGGLIPQTFDQLWRLAQIMSASGLMPKGLESVQAVFVAVQMGLEVGLSPMQAVQNIAVINNRPSIWGDAGLGLVRGSGLLEEFKEWHEGEGDNLTYYCHVKRKDEPDPAVGQFSIADAKQAGLLPADKLSAWTKYPKRMLQWRARAWPLRDKFTDVLKGLRIAEEMIDLKEAPNGIFKAVTSKEEAAKQDFEEATMPLDIEPLTKQFDASIPENTDLESLNTFLSKASETFEKPIDEIKAEATKDLDGFWKQFGIWESNQPSEKKEDPFDKYKGLGDTNFRKLVLASLDEIPTYPQESQNKIEASWRRRFADDYPVKKVEFEPGPGAEADENEASQDPASVIVDYTNDTDMMIPCDMVAGEVHVKKKCADSCEDSLRVRCPEFAKWRKKHPNVKL